MGAPECFVDVFPIQHGDIPASYVIAYQAGAGTLLQCMQRRKPRTLGGIFASEILDGRLVLCLLMQDPTWLVLGWQLPPEN